MANNPSVAVLISTCTEYQDIWELLNRSKRMFWPELALPHFYISEDLKTEPPRSSSWAPLDVGGRGRWSDNLISALAQLEAFDYVFLWMDDLILTGSAYPGLQRHMMKVLQDLSPAYLRLNPLEGTHQFKRSQHDVPLTVSPIPKGVVYRTSTVFSVWRRDVLRGLLRPGENAWQFEIAGSRRSDSIPGFYSYDQSTLQFANLVIQGAVYPPALRHIRRAGLDYQGPRRVMSALETLRRQLRVIRSRIFGLLPTAIQAWIHGILALRQYRSG